MVTATTVFNRPSYDHSYLTLPGSYLTPSHKEPLSPTDSDRCVCACAARCIHQPKPESSRCSGVPNELPQLTHCCHQCELENQCESVQSLSAAILTHMLCTCSVEINKQTLKAGKKGIKKIPAHFVSLFTLSRCIYAV